jgi:hypothetical protein
MIMAPITFELPARKTTTKNTDESADYLFDNATFVSRINQEDTAISNTVNNVGDCFTSDSNNKYKYSPYFKSKTDTVKTEETQEAQEASYLTYGDSLSEAVQSTITPFRHLERDWIDSHSDILKTYGGQWVVIEGTQLIACGADLPKVVQEAKTKGVAIPYAVKVPSDMELPVIG